jgi:DNA-binding transcriptional regulator YdaS (Cro superfamily)
MDALDRAIDILGTQENLARELGIRSPSISEWRTRGQVPIGRCEDIERVTKGRVTFAELRPDIATAVQRADAAARKRKRKTA